VKEGAALRVSVSLAWLSCVWWEFVNYLGMGSGGLAMVVAGFIARWTNGWGYS